MLQGPRATRGATGLGSSSTNRAPAASPDVVSPPPISDNTPQTEMHEKAMAGGTPQGWCLGMGGVLSSLSGALNEVARHYVAPSTDACSPDAAPPALNAGPLPTMVPSLLVVIRHFLGRQLGRTPDCSDKLVAACLQNIRFKVVKKGGTSRFVIVDASHRAAVEISEAQPAGICVFTGADQQFLASDVFCFIRSAFIALANPAASDSYNEEYAEAAGCSYLSKKHQREIFAFVSHVPHSIVVPPLFASDGCAAPLKLILDPRTIPHSSWPVISVRGVRKPDLPPTTPLALTCMPTAMPSVAWNTYLQPVETVAAAAARREAGAVEEAAGEGAAGAARSICSSQVPACPRAIVSSIRPAPCDSSQPLAAAASPPLAFVPLPNSIAAGSSAEKPAQARAGAELTSRRREEVRPSKNYGVGTHGAGGAAEPGHLPSNNCSDWLSNGEFV
eukprot:GHVT01029496.1.p1 GENE.GHVT01029496.1~~GHVT01029496.1.p1  ORF type:complete len:446 (-),score=85.97 GHVT01029496.1:20-1357(-)